MDVFVVESSDRNLLALWFSEQAKAYSFYNLSEGGKYVYSLPFSEAKGVRRGVKKYSGNLVEDLEIIHKLLSDRNFKFEPKSVVKSELPLEGYYSRIWRGYVGTGSSAVYNPGPLSSREFESQLSAKNAAASLYQELESVFRYMEPAEQNLKAYGHKLRELLILACTEVEANWRGILIENTASPDNSRQYKTTDYFKLKEPLRLGAWKIALKSYSKAPCCRPFSNWHKDKPTKTLEWYDAYNSVKHDRETMFPKATLLSVINALAGIHVLLEAQWGPDIHDPLKGGVSSPFKTIERPGPELSKVYVAVNSRHRKRLYLF